MARLTNRLTSLFIQRAKSPGRYCDGGGLYLEISKTGTKHWIFRFMLNGRARAMGLGPYPLVSLAEARTGALEARKKLEVPNKANRIDPIEERNEALRKKLEEEAKNETFSWCAAQYINSRRAGWKNPKHASQWENTLATYASPVIGALPVREIETTHVMRVLEPIWLEKTETANRVRNRIELILSWATVHEHRKGENPARWRGHLDKLLPKRAAVQGVEHFAALPINALGDFMARLRDQPGIAARAMEFLILTATRTGEVIGAQWSEFDLKENVWIIPAIRMKAKREHRVPLSPRTIEILETMRALQSHQFVFPGSKSNKPLSNMSLLAVLKRMNVEVTTHGFRSTFRDWVSERTNFPREVAEAALAHTLKDKVEAAYRRGDLFEKRKQLMIAWAKFCATQPSTAKNVIGIRERVPSSAQT